MKLLKLFFMIFLVSIPIFVNFDYRVLGQVRNFDIEANCMWGLGTPEDLNYYLENYENR